MGSVLEKSDDMIGKIWVFGFLVGLGMGAGDVIQDLVKEIYIYT